MSESIYDGIFPALLIPYNSDYSIDIDMLVNHIKYLFDHGAKGAAIFGTSGESANFSLNEKIQTLNSLIAKGIPSQRLIVGVGHNSVADTVEMIRESMRLNCLAVLWHPPSYYKNLADEGVIEYYSQCLNQIENRSALKVILYNFPANTCVPVTHNIIAKLMNAYPETIMGMKDSSFSYDHTYAIIQKFPKLKMYVGKDTDTSELVRNGAVGAIVAFSNMAPDLMQSLYEYGKDNTKPNRNDEILKLWDIVNGNSTANSRAIGLPALKGIMAALNGPKWLITRPPLTPLTSEEAAQLGSAMRSQNIRQ